MSNRTGVDINNALTVVIDGEAARVVDLTHHGALDLPLGGDLEEQVELLRAHHRHHAFLRLGHEDLARVKRGVAEQNVIEPHVHAARAVRSKLARGTRDACGAKVLDALNDIGRKEFEAALDEHLLHEGVAHLHRGALGGHAVFKGLRGKDRGAADAVATRTRAKEHHLVTNASGLGKVDLLVLHHTHAQRIDEGIALIRGIKRRSATDIWQAERVAVAADSRHHAVDDAGGVRVVDLAKAEFIHDSNGPRAHRKNVPHNAADAGGGSLIGLHVGGVVVGFDLEGDGPAVADVDHARVLTHAHHEAPLHLVGGLRTELTQVHLGRLIRAVLGPHDGVHREFCSRGAPAEQADDALVLIRFEAKLRVRHLVVRRRGGALNGVEVVVRGGDGGVSHAYPSAREVGGRCWAPAYRRAPPLSACALGGGEVMREGVLSVVQQVIPRETGSAYVETVIAFPGECLDAHHSTHNQGELVNNMRTDHRVGIGSDPQHVGVPRATRRAAIENDGAWADGRAGCRCECLARRAARQLWSIVEVLRRILARTIGEAV